MIQTFFPLPTITGVSALTRSPVTVGSSSVAVANTNAVFWVLTYP